MKLRKFRYVEHRGFQTFFENWKAKVLGTKTLSRGTGMSSDIEHYDSVDETRHDDVSDDETSDDEDDSNFSHL